MQAKNGLMYHWTLWTDPFTLESQVTKLEKKNKKKTNI
jgi:hypothetical protein